MKPAHPSTRARAILVAVVLTVAVLVLGPGAASASADTVEIAINTATPEQGVPINLTFSGSTGTIDQYGDGPYLYHGEPQTSPGHAAA